MRAPPMARRRGGTVPSTHHRLANAVHLMATTFERAAAVKPSPSLAHRITALARDAGSLARDHLELAVLDAHRAAVGLTKILTAAVVVSILAVTAWLAFVASAIVWATDNGVSWPVALVIAGVANLVVAGGLVFWIKSQTGELAFAATLRQFRRTAEEAKSEVS
jgi:hypothetical protein